MKLKKNYVCYTPINSSPSSTGRHFPSHHFVSISIPTITLLKRVSVSTFQQTITAGARAQGTRRFKVQEIYLPTYLFYIHRLGYLQTKSQRILNSNTLIQRLQTSGRTLLNSSDCSIQ